MIVNSPEAIILMQSTGNEVDNEQVLVWERLLQLAIDNNRSDTNDNLSMGEDEDLKIEANVDGNKSNQIKNKRAKLFDEVPEPGIELQVSQQEIFNNMLVPTNSLASQDALIAVSQNSVAGVAGQSILMSNVREKSDSQFRLHVAKSNQGLSISMRFNTPHVTRGIKLLEQLRDHLSLRGIAVQGLKLNGKDL